jgi:N-acetylglutamate synthase-like GNAT family acetyltransferase
MEDIENIKRKIKKLFALSSSSNPNEAAAALEKAKELMLEYSVHIDAAELANMQSVEVKAGSRGNSAPLHERELMNAVARAFGCRRAYGYTNGDGWYKVHAFIGPEHRVRIVSYIAEVLLRKMARARAAYIKSLYRVRKRYTKTCRADEFCRGWVRAVTDKLGAIAQSPEEKTALDDYERSLGWKTVGSPAGRTSKNENDWGNGLAAGRRVEIQHGVGAFDGRLSIGAPS